MIPRGEVGLIFASIGLTNGVLDDDLYGALLVVVLLYHRSSRRRSCDGESARVAVLAQRCPTSETRRSRRAAG